MLTWEFNVCLDRTRCLQSPQRHITHVYMSIFVRTLIIIMYSPGPYTTTNLILALTLKLSLNPQTGLWGNEDRQKCPHCPWMSSLWWCKTHSGPHKGSCTRTQTHTHLKTHSKAHTCKHTHPWRESRKGRMDSFSMRKHHHHHHITPNHSSDTLNMI